MYDSRGGGKKGGKRRDQQSRRGGYKNNNNNNINNNNGEGFSEWNAPPAGQMGLWQQFDFRSQMPQPGYDNQYQRGYNNSNYGTNNPHNDYSRQNNGNYDNGQPNGGSRQNHRNQQRKPAATKESRQVTKQQPPTEEEPNLPDTVTQTPPCKHNEWMCSDRRKFFVTLKCIACNQKWKTQLKKFNKCPDFHADERFCPKGNDCPHPHVYARSRLKEAPSRKKLAEEEENRKTDESKLRVIQTMPQMATEMSDSEQVREPPKAKTLPPQQWQATADSGLYIPEDIPAMDAESSLSYDIPTDTKASTLPTANGKDKSSRRQIRHIPTAPNAQTGTELGKSLELNSRSSTTPQACFVESSRLSASADSNSLNRCGTAPASKLREEEQSGIAKSATLPHCTMFPPPEEDEIIPGIQLNSVKKINVCTFLFDNVISNAFVLFINHSHSNNTNRPRELVVLTRPERTWLLLEMLCYPSMRCKLPLA